MNKIANILSSVSRKKVSPVISAVLCLAMVFGLSASALSLSYSVSAAKTEALIEQTGGSEVRDYIPISTMMKLSYEEPDIPLFLDAEPSTAEITISLKDADGNVLAGIPYTVTIQFLGEETKSDTEEKPSEEAEPVVLTDEDCDGIIRYEGPAPGRYSITLEHIEGFVSPEPVSVTVEKPVEHKAIKVEVKKASAAEMKQEDANYGQGNKGGGSAVTDTVEYVEPSKTLVPGTGEEKEVKDENGNTLYISIPKTVEKDGALYLVNADGSTSGIKVTLNGDGTIATAMSYEVKGIGGPEDEESGEGEPATGETPSGETPAGDTPGGDTPSGDTPGGDTPGGDTPGGDTPGGDTPSGDTPGGDTPGGDTPGGDTPINEEPTPDPPVTTVYHVTYKYEGVTDATVLATLPTDNAEYPSPEAISPVNPSQTSVATDAGTWSFNGWSRADGDNTVIFTGTWTFTAKQTETQPDPEPEKEWVDVLSRVLDPYGAPKKDSAGNNLYQFTSVEPKKEKTEEEYKYTGWQTLDGRTYYFDKDGNKVTGTQIIQGSQYVFSSEGVLSTATTKGIDVSQWNCYSTIDWTAVKNSGVSFVIVRCGIRGSTLGGIYEDDMFISNIRGAKAAGLKVGVYFFTLAATEQQAVEEASACVQMCARAGVGLDYPIFMDLEDPVSSGAQASAFKSVSAAQRTQIVKAFCETVRNSGYRAGLYANKYWLSAKVNTGALGSGTVIWLAHYTSQTDYSGRYEMWQYSGSGSVPGIRGAVDMNISYLGY